MAPCEDAASRNRAQQPAISTAVGHPYELSDFQEIRDLGQGSFGVVKEVKRRRSAEVFAMKTLEKSRIVERGMELQLKREVLIQLKVRHPNVVHLHYYFEDTFKIYCLLEYADRGQLFRYLKDQVSGLRESKAALFFGDTARGLAYLHGNRIIHRDVKPENVLLFGAEMRAKIGDFGWCVELTDAEPTRKTFCGTLEYLAPEMVRGLPHGESVDLWALGVLLFEMLLAHSPFMAGDRRSTMEAICASRFELPARSVSPGAEAIIRRLLSIRYSDRPRAVEVLDDNWVLQMHIAPEADEGQDFEWGAGKAAGTLEQPRHHGAALGSVRVGVADGVDNENRSLGGKGDVLSCRAEAEDVEVDVTVCAAREKLVAGAGSYQERSDQVAPQALDMKVFTSKFIDMDLLSTVDDSRISLEDIDEQLVNRSCTSSKTISTRECDFELTSNTIDDRCNLGRSGDTFVVRCAPKAKQRSLRREGSRFVPKWAAIERCIAQPTHTR